MKGRLWDWALGTLLTAVVLFGYWIPQAPIPFLKSLEFKSYDWRSQLRQTLDAGRDIALIAIDDDSIAQFGRWPWPRSRIAELLDKLKSAGPKVVGLDFVYSEPENSRGLSAIKALGDDYKGLVASRKVIDRHRAFEALISSAAARLDSDALLLKAVQESGNVVLPLFFAEKEGMGAPARNLPPALSKSGIRLVISGRATPGEVPEGFDPAAPIAPLAAAAEGIGHVNLDADFDGVVRGFFPVMRAGDSGYAYIPSYALSLVLAYTGLKSSDVSFSPGASVSLGQSEIPLDSSSRMLITFNGPYRTFRYYSFQDVMDGRVDPQAFKDKIVLVGVTATGVGTLYATPLSSEMPSIEIIANAVEDILRGRYISRPDWAVKAETALIVLVGLFIILALPRLKAFWGFTLSFLILIGLVGLGTYFFILGEWIKTSYPAFLLGAGYLLVISKRFFTTEKGKELVEASAIETNKMLGLSFQGQGMLDLAFEKFRLCPLDESLKETLYNLALDFERKRQFAKAASVLEWIAKKDRAYKDIESKIAMLKRASAGAVFSVPGAKKEGTVLLSAGAAKPTLGRYEIEKELGRGAMGVVYLGRDPKINRSVAIKTMTLEEGSGPEAAREIKERFFREAESAGKLNHPNIVRIFDAGEESEVAYIAMELLDGQNLLRFTDKRELLPPAKVMELVAIVAEALDYAHQQGIVHRDIKPANLMLLKDGTLRVADFGIARISASSKTATGTVLGTPSYMSPEQVAGKKVDGRADLFSLSVVFFEMLTGEKPFKGGEGIGTLLFQIANDPHPNASAVNPDVPPCAVAILDKGLAKSPDERYQRGADMAKDLRACSAAAAARTGQAARSNGETARLSTGGAS